MGSTAWFLVVASLWCGASEPELVFSKAELPALRQRVRQASDAALWSKLLGTARAYCTPGSPHFADPQHIDQAPAKVKSDRLVVHTFGRRLTDWMETIGFAYQITGDRQLGNHGAALLEAAARKLPVTHPLVAKGFAGGRGDIMRGLALGYDWLGEVMTDDQRRLWAVTSAGYVRNFLAEARREKTWWVPYHNYMGVCGGAAGCLALKLQEFYPQEADSWVRESARLVRTWFEQGFDDQGAGLEGTSYAAYGLSNAIPFAEALRRHGTPDLLLHPQLARILEFYALSLLPGEAVFDARNDANYDGFSNPWILLLAGTPNHGLAAWLWQQAGSGGGAQRIVYGEPREPIDPHAANVPLTRHFQGRGLIVVRTGWSRQDLMFALEAGPYYATTHNQADKGHFTLYGLGQRWAIDSGYGNDQTPLGRCQSVAHNIVLIDGQGQALSGASLGTTGKVRAFQDSARFGYAATDATEAYRQNSRGASGQPVRHAIRHALFVRPRGDAPAYVVLADDLEKDDDAHSFTWLMHTDAGMSVTLEPQGATLHPAARLEQVWAETPVGTTGRGRCEWKFRLAKPGSFAVWARVRAEPVESAKSDSFYVSLDDQKPIAWHMGDQGTWHWTRVSVGAAQDEVRFSLAPGEHRLRFETRESGAKIEQVVVTAAADPAPPPFQSTGHASVLAAKDAVLSPPMTLVRQPPDRTAPRLKLLLRAEGPVSMAVDSYDGHPRLNATVNAVRPGFLALLLPLPADQPDPALSVERHAGRQTVTIEWPSHTDRIVWSVSDSSGAALKIME